MDRTEALLRDIEELVTCESPSSDLAAVARCAGVVARLGAARLGREPEPVEVDGRSHLRWRFGDGRSRTSFEQQRVDAAIRALTPVFDGARLEVHGRPNRPPLEAAASSALFDRAAGIARRLGQPELIGVHVGGASDGNFTAGAGTATLDGLGAVGGGAHADDEHVVIAQLEPRTALLRELMADLLADVDRTDRS
jgi:di/tripeptidase